MHVIKPLIASFFRWLQPQVGIMDPKLHSLAYLRRHSALLLTAVLAAAVQMCPQLDTHATGLRLYAHVERLFLITLSTNAKSPDIVLVSVLGIRPRSCRRLT